MNALTVKEAIESLAGIYRHHAQTLRRYGAEKVAETLETVASDLDQTVAQYTPEWWRLNEIQAAKGWSERWLRERAQEFSEEMGPGHPLARKTDAGRWEVHTLAVEEIPTASDHKTEEIDPSDPGAIGDLLEVEEIDLSDPAAAARELASRGDL